MAARGGRIQVPSSRTRSHQAHTVMISPSSNADQTREKTWLEFT
jgi:hypothetical protein